MRGTMLLAALLAVMAATPPPATAAARAGAGKPAVKIKVHPKRLWRGYGFLPGYKQPPDNTDWRRPRPRADRDEIRYWTYGGQLLYGWGAPGFYRGRWNGGSFGPCWTYTPIGMMPTCGQ